MYTVLFQKGFNSDNFKQYWDFISYVNYNKCDI